MREVAAELGRLFSCVNRFSDSGTLQAKADVAALSRACRHICKQQPSDPLADTADMIPSISNPEHFA